MSVYPARAADEDLEQWVPATNAGFRNSINYLHTPSLLSSVGVEQSPDEMSYPRVAPKTRCVLSFRTDVKFRGFTSDWSGFGLISSPVCNATSAPARSASKSSKSRLARADHYFSLVSMFASSPISQIQDVRDGAIGALYLDSSNSEAFRASQL